MDHLIPESFLFEGTLPLAHRIGQPVRYIHRGRLQPRLADMIIMSFLMLDVLYVVSRTMTTPDLCHKALIEHSARFLTGKVSGSCSLISLKNPPMHNPPQGQIDPGRLIRCQQFAQVSCG